MSISSELSHAIAVIDAADDSQLQQLRTAVERRATALKKAEIAALAPGDRVRLVGNLSPRYLMGVTGVLRGTHGNKQRVEIADADRRYVDPRVIKYLHDGKYLHVPTACIAPA